MNTLGVILCVLGAAHSQLKFGGGGSSSSSSSISSSSGSTNTKSQGAVSTDTRFISTGSELIDGGIPGGNNGCYCGNGRRRREVGPGAAEEDSKTRFFGLETLLGGGQQNNCGCNCGYNQ